MIGAEEGNPREALSVIMQTLGRTYAAGGDIRPEEMDVIRPVLDEETLALYTPDLSDSIKNYFPPSCVSTRESNLGVPWVLRS